MDWQMSQRGVAVVAVWSCRILKAPREFRRPQADWFIGCGSESTAAAVAAEGHPDGQKEILNPWHRFTRGASGCRNPDSLIRGGESKGHRVMASSH
jgi:hypothetical protein